jgi:hypothetical protein
MSGGSSPTRTSCSSVQPSHAARLASCGTPAFITRDVRSPGNHLSRGDHHINAIESFWGYAKRCRAKFNNVPAFYLHLK